MTTPAPNFVEFAKMPLKHLPTDVLLALRDGIRKELGRRGHVGDDESAKRREAGTRNGLFGQRAGKTQQEVDFKKRLDELDGLMAQDWSDLFTGGSDERRFYVYAHVDPRKKAVKKGGEFPLFMQGMPFYIGKGVGRRAWELSRNEGHGVELRQLRSQGIADSEVICIVRDNLTEPEALEIESKLIYFFGTKFESGRKGILVNLDFPARPRFEVDTREMTLQHISRKLGIAAEAEAEAT